MKLQDYREFINEARIKFPAYHVGDVLIIGGHHIGSYVEFSKASLISSQRSSIYATYTSQGVLCKITEIDLQKKEYKVEYIDGIAKEVYRGRHKENYLNPNFKTYLKVKQNQLTEKGVSEIQELLKKKEFNAGELVSVKISQDRYVTREIIGLSISESIQNRELTYAIKDVTYYVKSSLIEKDVNIGMQEAEELLAKEIAKVLDTKLVDENDLYFSFDIYRLIGSEIIEGSLFFRTAEERTKFCKDLQTLIDDRLDANLQKVMNDGELSSVKVRDIAAGNKYYMGKITPKKIVQAAKNLGINIKEFLEKKRGQITGKRFNI